MRPACPKQGAASGEPLIVVEESGATDEEASSREGSPQLLLNPDLNPELLSPYRDMRKRSLPTPQCTSGITASQVRRLSEHGTEAASSAREAAFLATLTSGPQPAPGGRRHSVVTISRAPPPSILFGRGRRESIAAFPSGAARVLPNRRDSTSSVPRPLAGSSSGSQFNLQLDIMDDIAEIKAARKVRLKMWKTPSRERVCEVQPMDGASTRYHQVPPVPISRRHSDFVPAAATATQPQSRRASELPPTTSSAAAGIVCSNTDLISILSSLASSAQEINKERPEEDKMAAEQKRSRLKNLRSNSFDVSMLQGRGSPTSWFVKRHQPKKAEADPKVVWDGKSGSVVDAQALGSAIEVFLSRRGTEAPAGGSKSWFSGPPEEDAAADTCDTSLCSTLKDLFVK
ncbi:hypothetical protein C0J52_04931 [Blattella germanica]|nr:hypothetical protein C0J52_04931 [Blattella germanica]